MPFTRCWIIVASVGIVHWVLGCTPLQAQFNYYSQWTPVRGAPVPLDSQCKIADEPRSLSPREFLPKSFTKPTTVTFTAAPLRDVVHWLQTEHKLSVFLDAQDLSEEHLSLATPITERLDNEPIYFLLNRLELLGLGWLVEQGVLRITTCGLADDILSTVFYDLADLTSQGYDSQQVVDAICTCTRDGFGTNDGVSGAVAVRDQVLIANTTYDVHLEIAGLLAALRSPARRLLLMDPPEHVALRNQLAKSVSVDFDDIPLFEILKKIEQSTGVRIRLDQELLDGDGISPQTTAVLSVTNCPLRTVLDRLLGDFGLAYLLSNGEVLVTTESSMDSYRRPRIGVFDVRDLCRTSWEYGEFLSQLEKLIRSGSLLQSGSNCGAEFARPGVLVVRNREHVLDEVLEFLEAYRRELQKRPSNVRVENVSTRLYRVPTAMAEDLKSLLPELLSPDSWQSPERPNAIGTIRIAASEPGYLAQQSPPSYSPSDGEPPNAPPALFVTRSVLIIRQTESVHRELPEWIRRFRSGDRAFDP